MKKNIIIIIKSSNYNQLLNKNPNYQLKQLSKNQMKELLMKKNYVVVYVKLWMWFLTLVLMSCLY